MRRPLVRAALGLALALAAGAAGATAKPLALAEMLPANRTLAYVEVASLERAKAMIEPSDLGKLWAAFQPACDDLLAALDTSMADLYGQFESQTGVPAQTALDLLEGGFALGVVNLGEAGAEPRPALVLGFPTSAQLALDAVVAKLRERAGEEMPPVTVARKGGLAVVVAMAAPADVLLEPGAPEALAQAGGFKTVRARVWGGDAVAEGVYLVYANAAALLALAPPSPDFDRAKDAFGLEGLEGIGLGMSVVDGKIHDGLALATTGERRGLLKILASQPAVDARKLAEMVPHDVTSVAALSLDLVKLKSDLFDLAEAMEPGARAEGEKAMAEAELELGFSVDELLGAFGDLWILEANVPQDGLPLLSEQVFSVAVKDVARVNRVLSDLVARTGFEVRKLERGGVSVSYLLAPVGKLGEEPFGGDDEAAGMTIGAMSIARAWTIHNGRLYVSGAPNTIVERFERLKKGSLAESEGWKRTAGAMAPGARVLMFGRPDRAVGPLYHLVLWGLRLVEPVIRQAGVPLDTALLPSPAQVAGSLGASVTAWRVDERSMALVSSGGGVPVVTAVGGTLAFIAPALLFSDRAAEPMEPPSARAYPPPGFVLERLADAQREYKAERGTYAGSLEDLFAAGLIDPAFVYEHPGYGFVVVKADAESFVLQAHPHDPDSGQPGYVLTEQGGAPEEIPGLGK